MLNKPKNNLDEIREHLEVMQALDVNPDKWHRLKGTLAEHIDYCEKLGRENSRLSQCCGYLAGENRKLRRTLFLLMKDKGERP